MDNTAPPAPPSGPLLDLDTLIVRPAITIDGVRYEMFSPDELSVLTSHQLGIHGRRIEILSNGHNPDDGVELEKLISIVASEILVDVPAEIFAKLSGTHRHAIVDVFTGLLLRRKLGVAGAMATAMGDERIGEKLFPAFSASLVAPPAGGWWRRLRRLFART